MYIVRLISLQRGNSLQRDGKWKIAFGNLFPDVFSLLLLKYSFMGESLDKQQAAFWPWIENQK